MNSTFYKKAGKRQVKGRLLLIFIGCFMSVFSVSAFALSTTTCNDGNKYICCNQNWWTPLWDMDTGDSCDGGSSTSTCVKTDGIYGARMGTTCANV